jgi:isoleucyl-tRNA synthetase
MFLNFHFFFRRTLPSNLALVVHPDMTYVRAQDTTTEKIYILLEVLGLCEKKKLQKNDSQFSFFDFSHE